MGTFWPSSTHVREGADWLVVRIRLELATTMMVTTFNLERHGRHFPSPALLRFKYPEEDSNPRQHDGVGVGKGPQRLSAESGGYGLIMGVSANLVASKTPANGAFPTVSARVFGEARLVGGSHQTRTSDNNDGCNNSAAHCAHYRQAIGAKKPNNECYRIADFPLPEGPLASLFNLPRAGRASRAEA